MKPSNLINFKVFCSYRKEKKTIALQFSLIKKLCLIYCAEKQLQSFLEPILKLVILHQGKSKSINLLKCRLLNIHQTAICVPYFSHENYIVGIIDYQHPHIFLLCNVSLVGDRYTNTSQIKMSRVTLSRNIHNHQWPIIINRMKEEAM